MITLAILASPEGSTAIPPQYVEPVPATIWTNLGMTWTGANGVSFDLRSGSGLRVLFGGLTGLLNPKPQLRTAATPARGGARLRDVTIPERDVFWPLLAYTDAGSLEWQAHNEAFFSTLTWDRPGTWEVTRPDGTTRRLFVYFTDDGSSLERDPSASGWVKYPISGVALDPYWYGQETYRKFASTGNATTGLPGPGLPIGSSSTISTATIDNPGDVESYPKWKISGPCTSVTVGVTVNGVARLITVPFTLTAGQYVTIDTDTHSVRDQAGTSRRGELTSAFFVPIPPGQSVPLTMSMVGSGTVECWLPARYKRAI